MEKKREWKKKEENERWCYSKWGLLLIIDFHFLINPPLNKTSIVPSFFLVL
jgi:hypothetical protein